VAAIVLALTMSLLLGQSAATVRGRLTDASAESSGWKTVERWQRQLLSPLWHWLGSQVGLRPERPPDRDERRRRMRRLLSLHGAHEQSSSGDIEATAHQLVASTAHAGSIGWDVVRGRPEDLPARWSR
jgi:hypothetical protein